MQGLDKCVDKKKKYIYKILLHVFLLFFDSYSFLMRFHFLMRFCLNSNLEYVINLRLLLFLFFRCSLKLKNWWFRYSKCHGLSLPCYIIKYIKLRNIISIIVFLTLLIWISFVAARASLASRAFMNSYFVAVFVF